ncbi:MAG: Smr/MutS family protein [Nitrospirota bacterium]
MNSRKKEPPSFEILPFKDLKKNLESKRVKVPAAIPLPGKKNEQNDDELFDREMKEVSEIKEYREMPVFPRKTEYKSKNCSSDSEALKALEDIIKGKSPINLPDTPEYVEWVNRDYMEYIVEKLHKGQYAVQDCLDLHGISVEESGQEVESFLKESLKRGYRCIKIIHGRGLRSPDGPVLKGSVVKWLQSRYRKKIAAFVTARQCDGGLGALYILLR